MLTLNDVQWRALQQSEARQFVSAVCDELLANRPEMLTQPGRAVVLGRMQNIYDYAAEVGFTSTPHLVWLMYLSVDAPSFQDDPLVNGYLRKRGATPEQRLDELDAVMRHKLRGVN